MDRLTSRENYVGYLANRPGAVKFGSHGLFSQSDEPIDLDKVAKEIADHGGNVWTHVVSLRRDNAQAMGYDNIKAWRELVKRQVPNIAKQQKIDMANLKWYAAFHDKKTNPHVHIIVYSTNDREGFLTNHGIEKIRSGFANDIYSDELHHLYAQQTDLLANGKWLGKSCSFAKTVGTVAKASGAITFVMGGFDTLALGSKILFGDNWFSDFNAALHESSIYNIAQTTIASVAVFSGGMNSGFNKAANSAGVKPSCFVAGTLVMAVAGMVAIEKIKSGDKVISTDPETMETSPKTVLETYIREVTTLVHLTVNGEEIVTTVDHPFYVKNQGFIKAGELIVGDELLDVNGNVLLVENFDIELTEEPTTVYNFQVEGFHTYHVCTLGVLVHNADYNQSPKEIMAERTKGLDTREHPSKYKQISAKEKSRLESKVRDRTITKDEYKKLEWNKKISAKRQDAVNEFWDQEQIRLQKGENGTRNWSPQQKADILNGKRPTYNGKTIQGHHTYSVSKYPHLSGNSEVIYPATFNEHLKGWHGGNFRNNLPGEPIKTIIDF